MDELTSAQRGAVEALKGSRGPCPSAETLVAYEALSTDDRAGDPAHDHISTCSRCQLTLLHMAEPGAEKTSAMRWMLPLAALLVLAVSGTALWRAGALAPAGNNGNDVETVRGTELQPVAPIGSVDAIKEFSWQSPIRADRYRVRVTRGADAVFFGETSAQRIEAPVGLFETDVEYRWSVEAIDREGEVRMTSPPQAFTLSRRK